MDKFFFYECGTYAIFNHQGLPYFLNQINSVTIKGILRFKSNQCQINQRIKNHLDVYTREKSKNYFSFIKISKKNKKFLKKSSTTKQSIYDLHKNFYQYQIKNINLS
ncbi:hypothetical protein BpHYR1_030984 [Brachionus plicatilis]|uniref:Uncharacterized protein n=1 Tax=Brachionus plicatilis TaxID=10195 RepID=A0A3M7QJ71_BRAPC|nr:hypothetical protein BpHYR1_030984 [Brachionus plicatilis]